MTSTLQQEASRKLRFTAQTTMRVAQRLYERGYITYMRTDSTTLSETALTAARSQARELYGAEYVPDAPRRYDRKVKNAQEAHEAIRPAGERFRLPDEVRGELDRDEQSLYELVWMRTVASQMADARGQTVTLRLGATSASGEDAEFGVSGTVITFRGLPRRLRGGPRRGRPRTARSGACRRSSRATPSRRCSLEPQGHETVAARALHRGDARQGARGPRDRPAVDVRLDPLDDRRPRLRGQEGHRARPDLPRVRGHAARSRSTTSGSSTTASPLAWRTTSTGSPPARRSASTG